MVVGEVEIELMPDMPPTRIDLRERARKKGLPVQRYLDQEIDPC